MIDKYSWNEENIITINQIISVYSTLGIPHFQRGIVWKDEHIASLLESLYYDTPCGSIVLWKTNKEDLGLPLDKKFEYLIVDGQQRMRSICSILNNRSVPDNPTEKNSENRCWCINLSKLKEFNEFLKENEKHKRRKLFVKITDPVVSHKVVIERQKEGKRPPPFLYNFYNFVPIRYLMDKPLPEIYFKGNDNKQVEEGIFLDVKEKTNDFNKKIDFLKEEFEKIYSRELFVKTLKDKDNDTNSCMISIYNRINCGGLQAQKEEIAYATVSAYYKETHKKIKDIFEKIHGGPKDDERTFMDRMKERNFGFKFFMRVLTMTINNKFNASLGTRGLNFDNILSPNILKKITKEDWEKIWKKTEEVVIQIREILNNLKCDDLRFLPETSSLTPVIQILLQNEGEISSEDKKVLCGLTLILLLSELTEVQIYSIVSQIKMHRSKINGINWNCNQAISGFDKCNITEYLKLKNKVHGGDYNSNLEEFLKKRLDGKKSVVDRYTLMLYWLLISRNARDFSYMNNTDYPKKLLSQLKKKLPTGDKIASEEEDGVYIRNIFNPEKEHIIIFSEMKNLFGDSNRGSHILNNIGNITYISDELNGKDYGKWDKFLKLKDENKKNLEAHFLASEDLLNNYENIKKELDNENDSKTKEHFESFCKKRRELILNGFIKWVKEYN